MIIATANSKGGVGKTTIAVHLASWFRIYDYKTILVDCDAQKLSSRWLKPSTPDFPIHTTSDPQQIVSDLRDFKKQFEVVVVDGPGGLGDVTAAIFTQADAILVPTGASMLDIWALDWATGTLQEVHKLRNGLPQAVIIPVRVVDGYRTTRHLLAEARKLGFGITQHGLPHRQIYAQAAGLENRPPRLLWQLGRSKPVKQAALEMDALFQEVFPEACEHDIERVARLVTPKSKHTKNQRRIIENAREKVANT